jgi:hypothetical protein
MPKHQPSRVVPPRDVLKNLRLALERLERTGDLQSPSIADLRRIITQRIAELEALEAQQATGRRPPEADTTPSESP